MIVGARASTHYCSRTFENGIAHAHGVFEAYRAHPEVRPDLMVGHSGIGSTLLWPEYYPHAPIVNDFEHYHHPHGFNMDFRPDFAPMEVDSLHARARNNASTEDDETTQFGTWGTDFEPTAEPLMAS